MVVGIWTPLLSFPEEWGPIARTDPHVPTRCREVVLVFYSRDGETRTVRAGRVRLEGVRGDFNAMTTVLAPRTFDVVLHDWSTLPFLPSVAQLLPLRPGALFLQDLDAPRRPEREAHFLASSRGDQMESYKVQGEARKEVRGPQDSSGEHHQAMDSRFDA